MKKFSRKYFRPAAQTLVDNINRLAFHPDAFTLVMQTLPNPEGCYCRGVHTCGFYA